MSIHGQTYEGHPDEQRRGKRRDETDVAGIKKGGGNNKQDAF